MPSAANCRRAYKFRQPIPGSSYSVSARLQLNSVFWNPWKLPCRQWWTTRNLIYSEKR